MFKNITILMLSFSVAFFVIASVNSYAQAPTPQQKPAPSETQSNKTKITTNDGEFSIINFTADLLNPNADEDKDEPSETMPDAYQPDIIQEPEAENMKLAVLPTRKPTVDSPLETHKNSEDIERLLKLYKEGKTSDTLSKSEAQLYETIFKSQESGEFAEADKAIQKLKNPRLIGYVLSQRYLHEKSPRTSFSQLHEWLTLFADHIDAPRIYKLAVSRKPETHAGIIPSVVRSKGVARRVEPTMRKGKRYVSSRKRNDEEIRNINTINREIYKRIRSGEVTNGLNHLNENREIFDAVEYDVLAGEIAAAYLYAGEAEKADTLALAAIKRSGLHVPKAGWVAGLIAWKNKKYSHAARHFEIPARSSYASGWTATAGAYWAARSHMRTGNVKAVSTWLRRSLAQPRTFYGLISTRALGKDFDFNWKVPTFTKDQLEILQDIPAARRAMALVKSGQRDVAQAELIRIRPENNKQHKAILAYAGYIGMPALAMRLAGALPEGQGSYYDAALYPKGPWKPQSGFTVDPALVYAIMRQESRFNPRAESHTGATGLMQLMPATAKAVAKKVSLEDENALDNPETNLALGQKYLEDLLNTKTVDGNLLYLLIAYNAGPGNLAKWKKRWSDVSDPLLFIELLPSSETRAYVERVLSNYWIYRMREGQETPSLDAITSGKKADYKFKNL